MKTKNNQSTGALGEEAVAQYLINRHCEVIERNWRIREGEIDIVALNPTGVFSFVEVKTRSSVAFGHPFEAITAAKVRSMRKTANAYCFAHRVGPSIRLDAIAVYLRSGQTSVEHLKQVFR